jgi:hypothetical protein
MPQAFPRSPKQEEDLDTQGSRVRRPILPPFFSSEELSFKARQWDIQQECFDP